METVWAIFTSGSLPIWCDIHFPEATRAAARTFPPTPKGSNSCLQVCGGIPQENFFWDCPSLPFLTVLKSSLRVLKSALITVAWLALNFLERRKAGSEAAT